MKENPLKSKSFQYALEIINIYKVLTERKEFIMSRQLLKSGTSVGANIREANNAQSPPDFIHKLSISQKECDESLYWLELLSASNFISIQEFNHIYHKGNEILKIIKSSIITCKENSKKH